MSKSLNARCINRWKTEFKPICDSKVSPHWRKHHLRGVIRECALTTADCMVARLAESNAQVDFGGGGWTPEFSRWYATRREQYRKEALDYLNEEVTNDEIDEEISDELNAWND